MTSKSERPQIAEATWLPLPQPEPRMIRVPQTIDGGPLVDITTHRSLSPGSTVPDRPVAQESWLERFKLDRLSANENLNEEEKEFKLIWERYLLADPKRSSSLKLMPETIKLFVCRNWVWFWQRSHRRESFGKQIIAYWKQRLITAAVARDCIGLFHPPTVEQMVWTKSFHRVDWDEAALEDFVEDFGSLWDYLRWLVERQPVDKEENNTWSPVLDQLILLGRPVFLERDVKALRNTILSILDDMNKNPNAIQSMGAAQFAQCVHHNTLKGIRHGRESEFKRCDASRTELYSMEEYENEKHFESWHKGIDDHFEKQAAEYAKHWEWRRFQEVELLIHWYIGDIKLDALLLMLRKQRGGGTTPPGYKEDARLKPIGKPPLWKPAALDD